MLFTCCNITDKLKFAMLWIRFESHFNLRWLFSDAIFVFLKLKIKFVLKQIFIQIIGNFISKSLHILI